MDELIDDYQDFVYGTSRKGLLFGTYRLVLALAGMKDTPYWKFNGGMSMISEFFYKDLNPGR